jgi:hypothetical protein
MTVTAESARHLHLPRVYVPDSTNVVSLYTLSQLLQAHEDVHIYFEGREEDTDQEEEMVKRICPRAIKEIGPIAKGMERSVLFLREGMDQNTLKGPVEGYHRFVLIVSIAGAEDPVTNAFARSFSALEQEAKNCGYESYCILRLPPVYQNLNCINQGDLDIEGEFYGIDAEDAGSAISHILLDPELHKGEEYTVFSPAAVSSSTLKIVHSQLPRVHGIPFQTPSTILESIESKYWRQQQQRQGNDFSKITGGEEMASFEEFLRRTQQSLFHQRFIARDD